MSETSPMPTPLADVASDRVRDLDVRDELRGGGEPFERIMATAGALNEGEVLRLRAIFEPRPLYAVMASRGFEWWTQRLDADDWRVWFWRAGTIGDDEREREPSTTEE